MQYIVVGILASYADAEAATSDLAPAGIMGEQVEIISDMDEDVRTADTPGEPSTKPRVSARSRIAHLFGAGGPLKEPEVRDVPGEMPDYIGRQEFYATHVKQGGAVMIVRTPYTRSRRAAAAILHDHGARTLGRKDGPAVRVID